MNILLQAASHNQNDYDFLGLLFGLAIIVGLFLLFRSILLWYWRVDTIVKNQDMQIEQQKTIIDGLSAIYKILETPRKEG